MNMQQSIANNYMVLDISIGRADPMKHSAVASDAAAAECRVNGNVPSCGTASSPLAPCRRQWCRCSQSRRSWREWAATDQRPH